MATQSITWDDEAFVDIGHGVEITPLLLEDGTQVGLVERHYCSATERLQHGYVAFADGAVAGQTDRWTVEQDDPLTLSQSLLCGSGCGNHGWIRNGVWVPA